MYVGMLVRRVYITYSGDVQFVDLPHVCECRLNVATF